MSSLPTIGVDACLMFGVGAQAERKVKLKRALDDPCRELNHRECGHLSGGGRRGTRFVVVCTCGCHSECSALSAEAAEMDARCTCWDTREMRQRRAHASGVRAKKPHAISGGSSADGWEVSIGYIVAMAIILAVCVAALIIAVRAKGIVQGVAIGVSVVTGLYLAWVVLLSVFIRIVVKIVKALTSK